VTRGGLFGQVLAGEDLLGEDTGDTHHSGTSVVELSVLLADHLGGFLFPVVDLSKPDTVVTVKLGGRPPGKLDESRKDNDLGKSSSRDLEKSANTRVDIGKLQVVGRRKVSIESPLVVVDEGSKHGHHSNASMLALDSAVSFELGVIGDVTERIEESKRGGGTDLLFGNLERSARGLLRSKNAKSQRNGISNGEIQDKYKIN
jgi:hypothetical protein